MSKITAIEYGKKYNVGKDTVYRWTKNRKIKSAVRIGNFWYIDEDEKPNVKKRKKPNKRNTKICPCWSCQKACGRCTWSSVLQPVKGWKAIPNIIETEKQGVRKRPLWGYYLIECPEYVKDVPKKGRG